MNISDLQQVLRQRAGEAMPEYSDLLDVELLVGKGRARRRRRRMVAAGAAAVIVAGAVSIPLLLGGGSDSGGGPATLVPTVTPTPTLQSPTPSVSPASTPLPSISPSAPVTTSPVEVIPSVAPSSQPTVDTSILVYGDCLTPSLEPSQIVMTCADHGFFFQDLAWTSWTSKSATATGTEMYNDCTPSCAEGHFHSIPGATVTLTLPVSNPAGQRVWSQIQFFPQAPGYATGPYHGGPEPLPVRPN